MLESKYGIKHPIRGKVYEEDKMVDIYNFAINDMKDNHFFSSYDNRVYCIDDFIYLIMTRDVFKDIYEQAYNKGVEDGKKQNIKKNYKVNSLK